uniref:Uncharacterized protein n=1 Tax=Arundo donax TaxID=35708 RepID=A0A0A9FIK5_ARUDO
MNVKESEKSESKAAAVCSRGANQTRASKGERRGAREIPNRAAFVRFDSIRSV